MRILHVITTINRGGAENHLVDLAIGQATRGIDVTVAFLKGDHYWAMRLRAAGVRVELLELTRYGELAPIIRLRRAIHELAPDLIHAHMPPAELYTRLALLGHDLSPPHVVTKHNDEPSYRGLGHRTFGRWVGRRTRRVIVISNAIRRYMRNQMDLPDDRMRTIYYGVDYQPFGAVDNRTRQQLRAE
jgi:glycosyltransferase involved in cell wall biosynthesis